MIAVTFKRLVLFQLIFFFSLFPLTRRLCLFDSKFAYWVVSEKSVTNFLIGHQRQFAKNWKTWAQFVENGCSFSSETLKYSSWHLQKKKHKHCFCIFYKYCVTYKDWLLKNMLSIPTSYTLKKINSVTKQQKLING